MTKKKYKVIKDFGNPKKPERRKYLETLMADMGLTSLDELSPQERARWQRAAKPSPAAERKLREMKMKTEGCFDASSRSYKIRRLTKLASIKDSTGRISSVLDLLKNTLAPDTLVDIINILSPQELRSSNLNAYALRRKVDKVIEDSDIPPTAVGMHRPYVDALMAEVELYNSEYLKSMEIHTSLVPNSMPSSDSPQPPEVEADAPSGLFSKLTGNHILPGSSGEEVAALQEILIDLGYPLDRHGSDGVFRQETEDAIVLFQRQNGLAVTGFVDDATYNALIGSPQRMSESLQSEDGGGIISQHINFGNVSMSGFSPMMLEYLNRLNDAAEWTQGQIKITSGYRDEYGQARAMFHNYIQRGQGSSRAARYLRDLYNSPQFTNMEEIIEVFSGDVDGVSSNEEIINYAAEEYISKWPVRGHGAGRAIDISKSTGDNILETLFESQERATVDILDEGDHYHVTIRSLDPGGIEPGTLRTFNG